MNKVTVRGVDGSHRELSDEFKKKGITFYIAGVKAPVREVMRHSGPYGAPGGDHFFFTIDAAVRRFQERTGAGSFKSAISR